MSLLYQVYCTATEKYAKFKRRLDRNIASGRFKQFTKRKQAQLLHKVERLRRRVVQLSTQLKLATAGAAISLALSSSIAEAQTTLGPFERNYLNNPLPPPLPNLINPGTAYVDMDGDGDQDLVVAPYYSYFLRYFENVGSNTKPLFVEQENGSPKYPFNNVTFSTNEHPVSVAFSNVDSDGDFDMLVGTTKYGATHFYRNNGDANNPNFEPAAPGDDPFAGVSVQSGNIAYPVFADVDNDGDEDLVVGGYISYYATYGKLIQFYKNEDGVFTLQADIDNPFFYTGPTGTVDVEFADMDGDGDLDFIFTAYDTDSQQAKILYRRNDGNGVFTEQTGIFVFDSDNPSNSIGNPFEGDLNVSIITLSASDLDNDGDPDIILAYDLPPSYFTNLSLSQDFKRTFYYYRNGGNGNLEPLSGLDSPVDGVDMGNYASNSLVDVDNDGDQDIIASGTFSYQEGSQVKNSVFINTSFKFTPAPVGVNFPINDLSIPETFSFVKTIDVDSDGDLDVAIPLQANYNDTYSQVIYYENIDGVYTKKTGTDNPFNFILEFEMAQSLTNLNIDFDMADLDNDGKLDVILALENKPLMAFKNISEPNTPQFTEMTAWETGFGSSLYIGANPNIIDLDNDGDQDIVMGKYGHLWYYQNIGTPDAPAFTEYKSNTNNPFKDIFLFNINYGLSPFFADTDGDGDNDLLMGLDDGTFAFYQNNNPPPQPQLAANLNFIQGSGGTILDSNLSLTDTDNDNIIKAVFTIANFKPGEETLTCTPSGNITWNFDAANGILTLSGSATVADYVATLKTVTYQFTGAKPASSGRKTSESGRLITLNRSISLSALDADLTTPTPVVMAVQISFPNAVPALTASASSPTFTNGPVAIDPGVTITDGDDADLTSATITIDPATFKTAEDQLMFSDQNGISGSYSASTGILTLSGTASVANYQAAIRSVQYNNIASNATNQPRTITFTVNDGEANSNTTSIDVNVNVNTNSPPVISPNPITTQIGNSITVDLTSIASDPNNNLDLTTFKVITQPTSGASATIANGILTIDYSTVDFAGQDVVRIEVCDANSACAQADININVEGDITVHDAFSPNGDTFNQAWIISNITTLEPKNKVSLFTRWGDKVFEIDDYNNSDRVFDGTSNNGKDVSSGTYFYKIEFASGRKTLTGYLIIKR